MINAGCITLGDLEVQAEGTVTSAWSANVSDARGASIYVGRSAETGGDPSVVCYFQTTIDGVVPIDVAAVAMSSGAILPNLVADPLEQIEVTDGALPVGQAVNAVGVAFRMKVVVAGPLSEQATISGRIGVR